MLHHQGPSAFLTPELIDVLGLGPDQVDSIRQILGEMKGVQDQQKERQKQSSELLKAGGDLELEKTRKDQEKAQSQAHSYRLGKQAMVQIGQVLTRYRRNKYNRMIGEGFDLGKLTGPEGQRLIDDSADLTGWLLRQPAVQAELKLTAKQKDRLAREEPAAKVLEASQLARLRQIMLQSEGPAAVIRPDVAQALRLDDDQSAPSRRSSTSFSGHTGNSASH